tara:strand:+ start:193 stop:465 length:273 start_codon:yes stop_codon:yes gene_type:complete
MLEEKTIDQKNTLWNNKMAITFAISLILGTNAGSVFIQQQEYNTDKIEYNQLAEKRRLVHTIKKHELEQEIIFLKFQLKQYKNGEREEPN